MDCFTCQGIFLFALLGLAIDIAVAAENSFDVTKFGAVGNGVKDDAKGFQLAWEAACGAKSSNVIINVPRRTFLVSPVNFQGPCKPNSITFQILGKIVAPPMGAWQDKSVGVWLRFCSVNGLTLVGNKQGLINGRGETWWAKASADSDRPTAMFFNDCKNLRIQGLNYANSQRNHISISECQNVDVSNLDITAPSESPNTDGIDISMSTNVNIRQSVIATGDDCVAINGGTKQMNISSVACGPGHGISIGSLGRNGARDEVQGVVVSDCSFRGTQNGVRIKTWQGGSGFAKNIVFSNIKLNQVRNPLIIDQFYCPHSTCPPKDSAVEISDVRYEGIYGTSVSEEDIILNCSKAVPCTNIQLINIDIKPAKDSLRVRATCENVRGSAVNADQANKCFM